MFRRTKVCTAALAALGGALTLGAAPAFGQQELERVEITGSAIKRIDAETAVPVTILKVQDLKLEGITTVEQVVNRLASNQVSQGTSQSVGLGTGGATFANLRGLGQNKTLVLLNGRRIANNAIDSSAPDLNMIPFAALERVEVLRDGASALYGTDAIGGVINFITRKDYTGGTLTLGADAPQHAGAKAYNANVGFGTGDLTQDRYNLFGFLDYQKQNSLRASQRPAINNRSIKTSSATPAGNYNQGGAVGNASSPTCGSPDGVSKADPKTPGDQTCGYLYARQVDLIPISERWTGYLKGTVQLTSEDQLGLEWFTSTGSNATLIAGVPFSALYVNPNTKFFPGNGITPAITAFTYNPNYLPANAPATYQPGGVRVRWRDTPNGGRGEKTDNVQQRFIASLDGAVKGWDYRTAFSYNENKLTDRLTGGYADGNIITQGVLDGTINPFGGAQDAAGSALLASALATGTLFTGKGTVYSLDFQASRELGDLANTGRNAAIAIGAEIRREQFRYVGNPPFDEIVLSSTGFDPATDSQGARTVEAIYTELNIPVLKTLEFTGSVRYDHYSDFGDTLNPKVSFRFQPSKEMLFRGSYSTGFRAPSLFDLYAPRTFTNSADPLNDPLRSVTDAQGNCSPIGGATKSDVCDTQFMDLIGGNKQLAPEKSKSFNLGLVFEPTADLNVGFDFWWIKLTGQIGALSDTIIFGNPTKYAGAFHRASDGSLSIDGTQCPGFPVPATCGYFDSFSVNNGDVSTAGVDLSASYRLRTGNSGNFLFGFNGTYVSKFDYQNEPGGPFFNNVGVYGGGVALSSLQGGPVFRWQHTLSANWNLGGWGVGLVNHYKSHYVDQDPSNTVGAYSTWDAYTSWQPTKSLALTFGIRNLLDKEPPFSNQGATFQVGYDPRFADPTGRTYYFRGTLSF
jgi:iron complex outermembrane recepter protein